MIRHSCPDPYPTAQKRDEIAMHKIKLITPNQTWPHRWGETIHNNEDHVDQRLWACTSGEYQDWRKTQVASRSFSKTCLWSSHALSLLQASSCLPSYLASCHTLLWVPQIRDAVLVPKGYKSLYEGIYIRVPCRPILPTLDRCFTGSHS